MAAEARAEIAEKAAEEAGGGENTQQAQAGPEAAENGAPVDAGSGGGLAAESGVAATSARVRAALNAYAVTAEAPKASASGGLDTLG